MAITRGTERTGTGSTTTTTVTNVTCSGTDRYLEAVISFANTTSSVSGVTFNGSENLSLVTARNGGSGSNACRVEVWALVNPTASTGDVVFTHTSAFTAAKVQPYAGVDQTTTRNSNAASGGTTTAPTFAATLTWGGGDDILVMWGTNRNTSYTYTVDAGVTQVGVQVDSGSGASHSRVVNCEDFDTETGKVMGAISSSTGWGVIGYNLIAATAGGSSIAPISQQYHNAGMR